ncbi:MAG: FHA domain-containing protein [Myxococcales bacterium]|jgi:hypothetical protein
MISLRIRTRQGQETALPLAPGRHLAGGGDEASVNIAGLPPDALDLEVAADSVIVIARQPGFLISGQPLMVAQRRFVRPCDKLELGDVELSLEPPERALEDGTAALARGVLAGALQCGQTPVPTLIWLNGPDCGKRLPLFDEAVFLGRGEGSAARVRDELASRVHAKLVIKDGEARVVDLQSANGLFVDRKKVDGEQVLWGGEILQIGDTEIAFDANLQKPPEQPPPAAATSPEPEPQPEPAPPSEAPPDQSAAAGEAPAAEQPAIDPAPSARPRFAILEVAAIAAAALAAAGGLATAWLLLK